MSLSPHSPAAHHQTQSPRHPTSPSGRYLSDGSTPGSARQIDKHDSWDDCNVCPFGQVSDPERVRCAACSPGSEPNADGSDCLACGLGKCADAVIVVKCLDCAVSKPNYLTTKFFVAAQPNAQMDTNTNANAHAKPPTPPPGARVSSSQLVPS